MPHIISSLEEYHQAYEAAKNHPEQFWSAIAEDFVWRKKWDSICASDFHTGEIAWFKGAKLNITENCIDRHLPTLGEKPAIIWEPNDPQKPNRILTYNGLATQVNQFAQVLKNNGVKKGDRVCIYMGMIPELAIATLACARIGAIHSVIFGGFSSQAISDRLHDAKAKFILTCDGAFRGNKDIPLKHTIDDALINYTSIEKVIVVSHTNTPCSMLKGRDLWWDDEMKKVSDQGITTFPAEEMDAEDPLFILYTSGSTGKPKGVVHTTAGYMVWTNYTFENVFQYKKGQIHFCTADIG